ncbi:MAG: hypothetical protein VX475_15115, partial [Myxococcota bacterium]|nr:hypothetical protein [Myxococcota bacterium]
LAVVDVTNGADVDVRLITLELFLRHFLLTPLEVVGFLMRLQHIHLAGKTRASYGGLDADRLLAL